MRTRILFYLLSLVLTSEALCQNPPSTDIVVQEIVDRWGGWLKVESPNTIAKLSRTERERLIEHYLKEQDWLKHSGLSQSKRDILDPEVETKLLNLGEKLTLESYAERYKTAKLGEFAFDDAEEKLRYSLRPEVITLVAPMLFLEERFEFVQSGGDSASTIPKSYGVIGLVRTILIRSPMFSEQVRTWAREQDRIALQFSLAETRRWWKENEEAFRKENYLAVLPGRDLRDIMVQMPSDTNAPKGESVGPRSTGVDDSSGRAARGVVVDTSLFGAVAGDSEAKWSVGKVALFFALLFGIAGWISTILWKRK